MKVVFLKIILCLVLIWALFGIVKVVHILEGAEVTKYDVNGNEIYSNPGKGSNKLYYKYNDKNQVVETKSVMGDEVDYYIYYEYEGDLLRKQIFKNENSLEADYEILYEYNQQGLKTKKVDSLNGTTLYQYDENSNLIAETPPDNKTRTYEYDKNGRCIKEESSGGCVAEHEYDQKGRPLKSTYINHPFRGSCIARWEYFDDDPEISKKYYSESDFATTYMVFDKNDEYIETGIIWGDEFLTTKYKKITLCTHWKKGKIKSKRVYTLYRNEYSGSKK